MSSSKGTCLVARAIPCTRQSGTDADQLTEKLNRLSFDDFGNHRSKKSSRQADVISPNDFVALQSLRSSALARKTNTTWKNSRGGATLFADLANTREKKKEELSNKKRTDANGDGKEKKESEKSDAENEEEPSEGKEVKKKPGSRENTSEREKDLIDRGPVRNSRTPQAHHPYVGKNGHGIAPQSTVDDFSAYSGYGCGYECGNSWADSPEMIGYMSNSSTPDTVQSDLGYQSSSSPHHHSPFADHSMTTVELSYLLDATELPDALSDFILKYSRRYSASSPETNTDAKSVSEHSRTSSLSENFDASPKHRPVSADGGCDSPMSAGSAPQNSPAAPRGAVLGPSTPNEQPLSTVSQRQQLPSRKVDGVTRTAKDRLRSLISDGEMSEAWAWTCKCVQYFPGALCYQDTDRDSLLHIVTLHMDRAKIYALVEQMLKTEFPANQKPFDMPNRFHETPLFLAVEKKCAEVVAYLLEAGASPNHQTQRAERDAPLHYASARGMTEIVQIICANPLTNINLVNGMGLTPLLCAVKNHGVIEEESQCVIDSLPTIKVLLKNGADPLIADSTNGKTVIHYAVERMDAELIEVFKACVDEDTVSVLVNKPDLCRETPVESLQSTNAYQDPQNRSHIFLSLLTCGASVRNPQRVYQ